MRIFGFLFIFLTRIIPKNLTRSSIRVRQGLDFDGLRSGLDVFQARKTVLTIDVHRATAADTLTARPAGINFRV